MKYSIFFLTIGFVVINNCAGMDGRAKPRHAALIRTQSCSFNKPSQVEEEINSENERLPYGKTLGHLHERYKDDPEKFLKESALLFKNGIPCNIPGPAVEEQIIAGKKTITRLRSLSVSEIKKKMKEDEEKRSRPTTPRDVALGKGAIEKVISSQPEPLSESRKDLVLVNSDRNTNASS